jgi:hypothetical protein
MRSLKTLPVLAALTMFLTGVVPVSARAFAPVCGDLFRSEHALPEGRLAEFKKMAQLIKLRTLGENDLPFPSLTFDTYVNRERVQRPLPIVEELRPVLKKLGAEYFELLSDPGFVTHGREFIRFVRECGAPCAKMKPWDLREKFSERLGTTRRYRAIAIQKTELEKIKAEGFEARGLTAKKRGFLSTPMSEQLFEHVAHGSGSSQFISFSSHPEIAIAVARGFVKKNRIFLFEISIPKIDVVESRQHVFHLGFGRDVHVQTPDGVRTFSGVNETESFAFRRIAPARLTRVSDVTDTVYRLVD